MSANQNLEGTPLVSGKYYGPISVEDSTLLWGGGRTDMYWRGPKPSNIPAPVLSVGSPNLLEMAVNIAGIQGQTPYYYYLYVSQAPTGPFVSVGNAVDLSQRHAGSYIVWDFPSVTGTTYYFRVVCGNGFGLTAGAISAAIVG
jgi:hypothetical protein